MTKVSAVALDNYQQTDADIAIKELIDNLGGIDKFVGDGDKVFIKANLVRDMHPDKAGTTHPALITALVRLITSSTTASVVVGDSSGGTYTAGFMNTVYKRTCMTYVAENSNAKLNDNFNCTSTNIGGRVLFNTEIIDAFLEADVVINFTKLKTHSYTGYTGSVKNLYGLVGGLIKAELHSRFTDLGSFAQALIDIERFASNKISLHLIDAVVAMEGAGPTNGKPRHIGQVMASSDPYMLDYVACSLFCYPLSQPLLAKAVERGLLDPKLTDMQFDMDSWKANYISDFDHTEVKGTDIVLNAPMWCRKLIRNVMSKKVKIKPNCQACGKCAAHCPVKAINIEGKRAVVNQNKCIRCYCCQELCPFDAVELKETVMYKFSRKISGSTKKNKTK